MKPPGIKSEVKLSCKSEMTGSPHIKSKEQEVKPTVVPNPLCTEPENLKVEKKQYVSEFTLENFSKKAQDEPYKLDTPPKYTQDCGYKFSIGNDANGFDSSRGWELLMR